MPVPDFQSLMLPVLKAGPATARAKAETRNAGARLDPMFLMTEVEIVATCSLYNIDRAKQEKLIRRVVAPVCLDIEIDEIEGRFSNPVVLRDRFPVSLDAIEEVGEKIRQGTISRCRYGTKTALPARRQ